MSGKFRENRRVGPVWASMDSFMEQPITPIESLPAKPICVGLTCWYWEWRRPKAIVELGKRLGVNVELTQKFHGLHREIQAQVSGRNTDRFIGEFIRHC